MNNSEEEFEYHKPPPMLNWTEREAGLPGQPSLPSFQDEPSQAERIFLTLTDSWRTRVSQTDLDQPKLIETDDILLSCLLLAKKRGHTFTQVAYDDIRECISSAEKMRTSWLEKLPWELVYSARLETPSESLAVERLVANLNHHDSSIRIWLADIAWCVREWLRPETALAPLLENVATCIGGTDEYWGIAATLFKTEQEFHKASDSWQLTKDAEKFASQYSTTCERFKSIGTIATQAALWKQESRCWQIIAGSSFAIIRSSET